MSDTRENLVSLIGLQAIRIQELIEALQKQTAHSKAALAILTRLAEGRLPVECLKHEDGKFFVDEGAFKVNTEGVGRLYVKPPAPDGDNIVRLKQVAGHFPPLIDTPADNGSELEVPPKEAERHVVPGPPPLPDGPDPRMCAGN